MTNIDSAKIRINYHVTPMYYPHLFPDAPLQETEQLLVGNFLLTIVKDEMKYLKTLANVKFKC